MPILNAEPIMLSDGTNYTKQEGFLNLIVYYLCLLASIISIYVGSIIKIGKCR